MQFRILFLTIILAACSAQKERTGEKELTETSYAKHLSIVTKGDAFLVTLKNSDNKSTFKFWLSKSKPKNLEQGVQYIQVPVTKIVALSSTHLGMLGKLGKLSVVSGVGNADYIYSSFILSKLKSGKVIAFGDDQEISPEKLIAHQPDIVLFSGFDVDFPNSDRLLEYGIICMPDFDWKESHPLGKAEWIKLFGCLTGNYQKAKTYFDEVVTSYVACAKVANQHTKKLKILSGNRIGDLWYCPAGKSYFAQLYRDAGFDYPYAHTSGVGSISFNFERIMAENQNVDIWMNPGAPTKERVTSGDSRYRLLKPFQTGEIFCYSHQMNRFWELSAIEPHKVLEDMRKIANGQANKSFHFYKRIP